MSHVTSIYIPYRKDTTLRLVSLVSVTIVQAKRIVCEFWGANKLSHTCERKREKQTEYVHLVHLVYYMEISLVCAPFPRFPLYLFVSLITLPFTLTRVSLYQETTPPVASCFIPLSLPLLFPNIHLSVLSNYANTKWNIIISIKKIRFTAKNFL